MNTIEEKRRSYWAQNRLVTLGLLAVWALVTYVAPFFARELNEFTFLGFPFGFYLGAQGALLVYVAAIGYYAWYMNRLDRKFTRGDR